MLFFIILEFDRDAVNSSRESVSLEKHIKAIFLYIA